MNSKLKTVLVLLVAGLVFGGVLGWFLSRQGNVTEVPLPQSTAVIKTNALAVVSSNQVEAVQQSNQEMAVDMAETSNVATNWEEKLDNVLVSDADDAAKAASILALIPDAPEEGKVELAQHLVNMVQDDNYTATGELLTNTNTPPEVSSVLMNDLLNRGNQLKLPMLLAVARTENHPLASDAKDMLELFVGEDKGSNWDEWKTAIDKWLKENEEDASPKPE